MSINNSQNCNPIGESARGSEGGDNNDPGETDFAEPLIAGELKYLENKSTMKNREDDLKIQRIANRIAMGVILASIIAMLWFFCGSLSAFMSRSKLVYELKNIFTMENWGFLGKQRKYQSSFGFLTGIASQKYFEAVFKSSFIAHIRHKLSWHNQQSAVEENFEIILLAMSTLFFPKCLIIVFLFQTITSYAPSNISLARDSAILYCVGSITISEFMEIISYFVENINPVSTIYKRMVKKRLKSSLFDAEVSVDGTFSLATCDNLNINIRTKEGHKLAFFSAKSINILSLLRIANLITFHLLPQYAIMKLLPRQYYNFLFNIQSDFSHNETNLGEKVILKFVKWIAVLMSMIIRSVCMLLFSVYSLIVEKSHTNHNTNAILFDGITIEVNPSMMEHIKTTKSRSNLSLLQFITENVTRNEHVQAAIFSSKVIITNVKILFPRSYITSYDEGFLPQKRAEMKSMFDENLFHSDVNEFISKLTQHQGFSDLNFSCDYADQKAQLEKVITNLLSSNFESDKFKEIKMAFDQLCAREPISPAKCKSFKAKRYPVSRSLNISSIKIESKSVRSSKKECILKVGRSTVTTALDGAQTKFEDQVLEHHQTVVSYNFSDGRVSNLKLFNKVYTLSIPISLMEQFSQSRKAHKSESSDLSLLNFNKLIDSFTSIGFKLSKLSMFDKFYFHSSQDRKLDAAKSSTIQISIDDFLLNLKKITVAEYGSYFEFRDNYSNQDSSTSTIPTDYAVGKVTHEVVFSVASVQAKLLSNNGSKKDNIFHLPWMSSVIRTNLYNVWGLYSVINHLANLKVLSDSLQSDLDFLINTPYEFFINISINNPSLNLHPDNIFPLLLCSNYYSHENEDFGPERSEPGSQTSGPGSKTSDSKLTCAPKEFRDAVKMNLKYLLQLMPVVKAKLNVSEIFIKISQLSFPVTTFDKAAIEKISFVTECRKFVYEIQSVKPKSSAVDPYSNESDSDTAVEKNDSEKSEHYEADNVDIAVSPDTEIVGDTSYMDTSYIYDRSSRFHKSFKTHFKLSVVVVKSYHSNCNDSAGTHPFPVLHFKSYESNADIDFNFSRLAEPEYGKLRNYIFDHFKVNLVLASYLSNVVINLTKMPIIFGLCKLAKLAKLKSKGNSQVQKPESLIERLKILVLDRKAFLKIDGIVISIGSRNYLLSNDFGGAELDQGLRGFQFCFGKVSSEFWRNGKSVIQLNLNADKFNISTIHEDSDCLAIAGKPVVSKFICIPGIALHYGESLTTRIPKVEIDMSVKTVWLLFAFNHLVHLTKIYMGTSLQPSNKKNWPLPFFEFAINFLELKITFPGNGFLVFGITQLSGDVDFVKKEHSIELRSLKVYTPLQENHETLFCLINLTNVQHLFKYNESKDISGQNFSFLTEEFSFSLPFGFVFYEISDAIVTLFKSFKQIKHNYEMLNRGLECSPLVPEVEAAKKLPNINIKAHKFQVSIKDDEFEAQLGLIYKSGLLEQRERYEKMVVFIEKTRQMITDLDPNLRSSFSGHKEQLVSKIERYIEQLDSTMCSLDAIKFDDNLSLKAQRQLHNFLKMIMSKKEILHENFSKSWIKRFAKMKEEQDLMIHNRNMMFLSDPVNDREIESHYSIKDLVERPSLFSLNSSNININLSEFQSTTDLETYLYDIGKGMPKNSKYTLLIPMFLQIKCDFLTIMIRDYYLPIIQFPEADDDIALTISGNVVFAERFNINPVSRRTIFVPFTHCLNSNISDTSFFQAQPFYGAHISRSLDPIKCFTDMKFISGSRKSTILSWGKSLQPAISTVMLCLDNVTKPPIDKSPKIGWWDKFRLIMHGRFQFQWPKSKVSLFIKGSINPYKVTDEGGGLVFSWDKGVVLDINPDDDPACFMTTISKQFTLAVPHFASSIVEYWRTPKTKLVESNEYYKVLALLEGDVRWKVGLMFEKEEDDNYRNSNPGDTPRTSKFKHHYEIERANPELVTDGNHDSYKGFRSQYIHLAIGFSNKNSDPNCKLNETYNAFYLSPRSINYFTKWWSLFNNSLGLPIRNGLLFGQDKRDRKDEVKFGASLFTVKYQIQLAPGFVASVARHGSLVKSSDQIEFTGIKMKTNEFLLDLHQQRQKMHHTDENLGISKSVYNLRFCDGKVNCDSCDVRVIKTVFSESSIEDILAESLGVDDDTFSTISSDSDSGMCITPELSKLDEFKFLSSQEAVTEAERLYYWVDPKDYVELEVEDPVSQKPKIQIVPLLTTPRFTYLRQNDLNAIAQMYPFGDEPSHMCLYNEINTSEETSLEIVHQRSQDVQSKIKYYKDKILELKKLKSFSNIDLEYMEDQLAALRHNLRTIRRVIDESKGFLAFASIEEPYLDPVNHNLPPPHETRHLNRSYSSHLLEPQEQFHGLASTRSGVSSGVSFSELLDAKNFAIAHSKYRNRYIVTNLLLKWNDILRDNLQSYYTQFGDMKSLRYFMGHKLIKSLREMSDSSKARRKNVKNRGDNFSMFEDVFQDILNLTSNEYISSFEEEFVKVDESVAEVDYSSLFKFLCPQIQLHTKETKRNVVLLLAQDIELKSIEVNTADSDRASDDDELSRLIESRYSLVLKDMKTFVIGSENVVRDKGVLFHSESFGNDSSVAPNWPPWVNFEGFFESSLLKHLLLSDEASVLLRFDKVNNLFFINNKEAAAFKWKDKDILRIDAPEFVVTCDSSQFEVIYSIATNLMVSSALKDDKKSRQLRTLVLASDLENVRDVPEFVEEIQSQIRALRGMKHQLQMRGSDGKESLLINLWLSKLTLKLLYTVRALKMSDLKDVGMRNELLWRACAKRVVFKLLDEKRKPFVDLVLLDSSYSRTDHTNGSTTNSIRIGDVEGTYLSEGAPYSKLIGSYNFGEPGSSMMVEVDWKIQQPIGGIPVMEYLTFEFQPLKIEVDTETARRVFNFVFPVKAHDSSRNSLEFNANGSKLKAFARSPSLNSNRSTVRAGMTTSRPSNHNNQYLVMAKRSTEYVNFNRAEIKEVTLCLSYKGKGHTSIADVENLVVRVPTLAYFDCITSFKGLALLVKKDVVRVLLKHTGDIIGNKIKRRLKPGTNQYPEIRIASSISRSDDHSSLQLQTERFTDLNTSMVIEETGEDYREFEDKEGEKEVESNDVDEEVVRL